ncbi:uncharacterized protein SAPINGB_P005748 [Magnusiomyces paraingens]|uniref:F-box domain-containing protein n=1 Tax=Magnusiomyces paraingens TaxID=2606893 RepID=A0A5E8C1Q8_9ASCO|nr:uncharacterized protein SAPINGB_P005748 [Saprochaete ingens]VVT57543.1 unnamed protein product [Saprochaete ingens]
MSSLNTLPLEALHQIVSYVPYEDFKNLRQSCAKLHDSLEPLYWEGCVIDLSDPFKKPIRIISQLFDSESDEDVSDCLGYNLLKEKYQRVFKYPVVPWKVFNNPGGIFSVECYKITEFPDVMNSFSNTLKNLKLLFSLSDAGKTLLVSPGFELNNLESLFIETTNGGPYLKDFFSQCSKWPNLKTLTLSTRVILESINTGQKTLYSTHEEVLSLQAIPHVQNCRLKIDICEASRLLDVQKPLSDLPYVNVPAITTLEIEDEASLLGFEMLNQVWNFPNAELELLITRKEYPQALVEYLPIISQHINILSFFLPFNFVFSHRPVFPKFQSLSCLHFQPVAYESYGNVYLSEYTDEGKIKSFLEQFLLNFRETDPKNELETVKIIEPLLEKFCIDKDQYQPLIDVLCGLTTDSKNMMHLLETFSRFPTKVSCSQSIYSIAVNEMIFRDMMEIKNLKYLSVEMSKGFYPSPYLQRLAEIHTSLQQIRMFSKKNTTSISLKIPSYAPSVVGMGDEYSRLQQPIPLSQKETEKYMYNVFPDVHYKYFFEFDVSTNVVYGYGDPDVTVTVMIDCVIDVARKRRFLNTPYQQAFIPESQVSKDLKFYKHNIYDFDLMIKGPNFQGWL